MWLDKFMLWGHVLCAAGHSSVIQLLPGSRLKRAPSFRDWFPSVVAEFVPQFCFRVSFPGLVPEFCSRILFLILGFEFCSRFSFPSLVPEFCSCILFPCFAADFVPDFHSQFLLQIFDPDFSRLVPEFCSRVFFSPDLGSDFCSQYYLPSVMVCSLMFCYVLFPILFPFFVSKFYSPTLRPEFWSQFLFQILFPDFCSRSLVPILFRSFVPDSVLLFFSDFSCRFLLPTVVPEFSC